MKILIIRPPLDNLIEANVPKIIEEYRGTYPPIGLMALISYLKMNTEADVKMIDCQLEKLNYKEIKKIIIKEKADIIGIQVMTFTLLDCIKIAKMVKQIDNNIKIVFGGRHPTLFPKETINFSFVDYLIIGDGEIPFSNLIKNIDEYSKLKMLKGIVFKYKNKIVNNGPFINKNLNKLPFPFTQVSKNDYKYILQKEKKFTTLITSIGCSYSCTFCDENVIKYRERETKNIISEIEYYIKKKNIRDFFIYDSNFTVNRKRALDFCKQLISRNIRINFAIRSRIDLIDEELLYFLQKSGCKRIQFGIESLNNGTLDVLKKGFDVDKIYNKIKIIKKYDIDVLADFMIGTPNEEKTEILNMLDKINKLGIDYAHFSVLKLYPGTQLYQNWIKKKINNNFWKTFSENPSKMEICSINKNLNKKELNKLLIDSYKKFYINSHFIIHQVLRIQSFTDLFNKCRIFTKIISM